MSNTTMMPAPVRPVAMSVRDEALAVIRELQSVFVPSPLDLNGLLTRARLAGLYDPNWTPNRPGASAALEPIRDLLRGLRAGLGHLTPLQLQTLQVGPRDAQMRAEAARIMTLHPGLVAWQGWLDGLGAVQAAAHRADMERRKEAERMKRQRQRAEAAVELLRRLAASGITLTAGRDTVKAHPAALLTAVDRAALQEFHSEIHDLLTAPPAIITRTGVVA